MFLIQLQGWVWIIFQSKIIIYTKYTSNTCLASLSFDRKIKYCAANTHPTYFIKKSHPGAGAGFKNTIKCWLCEIFARPILKNLKLPFLQPKNLRVALSFMSFCSCVKLKKGEIEFCTKIYKDLHRTTLQSIYLRTSPGVSWKIIFRQNFEEMWDIPNHTDVLPIK